MCEDFLWLCFISLWQKENPELEKNSSQNLKKEISFPLHYGMSGLENLSGSKKSLNKSRKKFISESFIQKDCSNEFSGIKNYQSDLINSEAMRNVIVRLIHRWIDCIQMILLDHYRFGQNGLDNDAGMI